MIWIVLAFGVLVTGIGAAVLVSVNLFKRWLAFWLEGRRIYFAAILRLAAGAVFVAASSQCRLPEVILGLGILFLISGVLVLVLGLNRLRALVQWWSRQPPAMIRAWALLATALGVLILYASWPGSGPGPASG